MAMEDDSKDVFSFYSDAPPKYELLEIIPLRKGVDWLDNLAEDERENSRIRQLAGDVSDIMEANGFYSLFGKYVHQNNKAMDIYAHRISGVFKNFLYVDCEYNHSSLTPSFGTGYAWVETAPGKEDLWDLSRKHPKIKRSYTNLSWNNIDIHLHERTSKILSFNDYNSYDDISSSLCRKMYKNIKNIGLEDTFVRISIVGNNEGLYAFYAIFDQKSERTKSINTLQTILQSYSKGAGK
jgi:hypothetical protein